MQLDKLRPRRNDYAQDWPELAYKNDCLCQKEELLDKMNELLVSQTSELHVECQSLEEEINVSCKPDQWNQDLVLDLLSLKHCFLHLPRHACPLCRIVWHTLTAAKLIITCTVQKSRTMKIECSIKGRPPLDFHELLHQWCVQMS